MTRTLLWTEYKGDYKYIALHGLTGNNKDLLVFKFYPGQAETLIHKHFYSQ